MGMARKKKTEARWRVPPCTPEQLDVRYKNLVDQLVETAIGSRFKWDSATQNFYRTLAKELGIRNWRFKVDAIRDSLLECRSLDPGDIRQEVLIILLEYHKQYLAKRQKAGFTVYVLLNSPRRLAEVMGRHLLAEWGDKKHPIFSEECWMEDPEPLTLNLGWVALKSQEGVFKRLSLYQKYLLFLRHKNSMTVEQIANLLHRHVSYIEADFGRINRILSEFKE